MKKNNKPYFIPDETPLPLKSCLFCPLISVSSNGIEEKEIPHEGESSLSSPSTPKVASNSTATTTAHPREIEPKSQFRTIKNCLNHMLKVHGFFIPFVEHLTDLEGFLNYLGAKVGVGHVCLWCGKEKKSVESVQQHMIHKGHCKIRLETEEDEEEYFEYYTFEEDKVEDEKDKIEKEEKKENSMELKKEKLMEKPRLTFEKTPFEQEFKTLLRLATIETIANSKQIPEHLKHIAQEEKEKKRKRYWNSTCVTSRICK